MFPQHYSDKEKVTPRVEGSKGITTAEVKTEKELVVVPKAKRVSKERKAKCSSKVRRKGEAIIEQLL